MTTLVTSFLIGSSPFLQASRKLIVSRMGSKFGRICLGTYELHAIGRLEKFPKTYNWENVVTTLVLSIFNGSSPFLQTRRTTIKA